MVRHAAIALLPLIALMACVDRSLLSDEAKATHEIGTRGGQPVFEFTNEWDTRPAPRALKDTFLKRKAVRFCTNYQILSRTPNGTRPGPREMIPGTLLWLPTSLASEKVRITCPK